MKSKMLFFKNKKSSKSPQNDPVLVAVIPDLPFSEMYQEMLRENGIPFICRQRGAAGYIKILTGGLLVADNIYVNSKNYDKALELYNIYLNPENEV